MTKNTNGTYEVGYKKPPTGSQFKKGQSGNPRGRSVGSRNKSAYAFGDECLKAMLLKEAYRGITIQDQGKSITISILQAIVRSLAVSAAKGNIRAQRLIFETVAKIESENTKALLTYYDNLTDYKTGWEKEIARCKQQGLPLPEPLPHPDDIKVNKRTGRVTVEGPMTPDEKSDWDMLRKRKAECIFAIEIGQKLLNEEPNCEYKKLVLNGIKTEQSNLDKIRQLIPD
jgi:hypothetical protein